MGNKDTRAGIAAIILAVLFVGVKFLVAIINLFYTDQPINIDSSITVPYVSSIIILFMYYIYGRLEKIVSKEDQILSAPARGIEIFETTEDFISRLTECTVGAESVSTLNLSPALGASPELDAYFKSVHKYILNKRNDSLKSFRTLANIENPTKAKWLLDRLELLRGSSVVSTNIFPEGATVHFPLGFHIVRKKNNTYVFFYPPVNLTGVMSAFLVTNNEVARLMLNYFDIVWSESIKLHHGKEIYKSGLNALVQANPQLADITYFKQALEDAT